MILEVPLTVASIWRLARIEPPTGGRDKRDRLVPTGNREAPSSSPVTQQAPVATGDPAGPRVCYAIDDKR